MGAIATAKGDTRPAEQINPVYLVDQTTGLPASGGGMTIAYPSLPASTDRSGTATTTSGVLNVPANASRKSLVGQNVGANNIGFNEQGGAAVIGALGTYTVVPGGSFSVSTNKQVNFIAATGNTAVTMTET